MVAHRQLQHRRLGDSSRTLKSAGTVTGAEQRRILDDVVEARNRVEDARIMRDLVAGTVLQDDPDYRKLREIRRSGNLPRVRSQTFWKDLPLETSEHWEMAFDIVVDHVWGSNRIEAADWAHRGSSSHQAELGAIDGRALATGTDALRCSIALRHMAHGSARARSAPCGTTGRSGTTIVAHRTPSSQNQPASQPRIVSVDEIAGRYERTNPMAND